VLVITSLVLLSAIHHGVMCEEGGRDTGQCYNLRARACLCVCLIVGGHRVKCLNVLTDIL
jgi:hypothetical protein